jgi:hypothetical protein
MEWPAIMRGVLFVACVNASFLRGERARPYHLRRGGYWDHPCAGMYLVMNTYSFPELLEQIVRANRFALGVGGG